MKLNLILVLSAFTTMKAMALDFPIQMPNTTSQFLFTESINKQIGFSVNQKDQSLKDYFDNSKNPPASELCGPTTIANMMAALKLTTNADLSLKYSPLNSDYINQVIELNNLCKTDKKAGTLIVNMSSCIDNVFKQSGYTDSDVKVLGPIILPNLQTQFQTTPKNIDINDIRTAIKNNYSVILEVKWFHVDENSNPLNWVSTGGHYILVVGYDYDDSFGDSRIILKVVNPEVNYMSRAPFQRFDNIEMMKIPKKAGMNYPEGSDYILDGYNFKGYPNRAFVKFLILSKPHQIATGLN